MQHQYLRLTFGAVLQSYDEELSILTSNLLEQSSNFSLQASEAQAIGAWAPIFCCFGGVFSLFELIADV